MAECKTFIEVGRENQHLKTMRRQKDKFYKPLYKKQEKENKHTCLHGIHNDHHSNPTSPNNYRNCIQIGVETTSSNSSDQGIISTEETPEEKENNWVKNLSTSTLTKGQIKALAHGPNYAIVPRNPPTGEYITAIENVCNQLQSGKAKELRGEIKSALKNIQPPRPNITREERKAIEELRKDNTKMILTVDKGVSMVVMNKDDYHQKAEALLQESAYRAITSDPTNKYKNKLISLLKSIKANGGINEITYRKLYPTGAGSPKFYGLPKLHKEGTPLRPIVSSIGAVTYTTSKELSRILRPLVGKSPHHICNNHDFLEDLKTIKLGPEEVMVSFDVKALFTSVPIKPALEIIEKLLKEDQDPQKRTSMSISNIMDLLEFCLRSTYFTYRGKFYEQVEGAAMGSPISPIIANLFMEHFEIQALQSSPNPPLLWKRFVDDTFVIINKAHKEEFLAHINSVDSNIQFTAEEPGPDGSLPFLDILISPDEEGKLITSVYRKPTHTDQYLQWDSHHPISAKYSVVGTLYHRAKTISSNSEKLHQEDDHLTRALGDCKYPRWALNRVKMKMNNPTKTQKKKKNEHSQPNNPRPYITVPYYRGLSESVKKKCSNYGVQVYFKGGSTIKNLLMAPKDKDPMMKKSGVIYSYKCGRVDCDEEYIGESSRTFAERFKEHQKAPSPIFDHHTITGHDISVDHFNIVGKEENNLKRAIKEALYIRVNNPSLNRNVGKYHLPHIWDEFLDNISELKLK